MLELPNKQSHRKVLLSSFQLNGHTLGFYLGTQKLQLPFYNVRDSATEEYCSVVFIWMVTLRDFIQKVES